jgi:hypothetical protein
MNYVYFTGTLDAAVSGAELAGGEDPGRIYIVEPTGDFEDDPNVTDRKFPGNPAQSFVAVRPCVSLASFSTGSAIRPRSSSPCGLHAMHRSGAEKRRSRTRSTPNSPLRGRSEFWPSREKPLGGLLILLLPGAVVFRPQGVDSPACGNTVRKILCVV